MCLSINKQVVILLSHKNLWNQNICLLSTRFTTTVWLSLCDIYVIIIYNTICYFTCGRPMSAPTVATENFIYFVTNQNWYSGNCEWRWLLFIKLRPCQCVLFIVRLSSTLSLKTVVFFYLLFVLRLLSPRLKYSSLALCINALPYAPYFRQCFAPFFRHRRRSQGYLKSRHYSLT